MKLKKAGNWICLMIIFIVFTSYTPSYTTLVINGKIIHTESRKAIDNAYIYVIAGEEETLSTKEGAFKLKTWQKFPLTVVVEHTEYASRKIILQNPTAELVISLDKKR